jgi:hypothetical protein
VKEEPPRAQRISSETDDLFTDDLGDVIVIEETLWCTATIAPRDVRGIRPLPEQQTFGIWRLVKDEQPVFVGFSARFASDRFTARGQKRELAIEGVMGEHLVISLATPAKIGRCAGCGPR